MATREVSNGTRTIERLTNEGTPGYYTGNPLTKQRDLTTQEAAELAAVDAAITEASNKATLESRLDAAETANNNYLAIASPTTAQNTAYLKTVAKELNGVIHIIRGRFNDISNT